MEEKFITEALIEQLAGDLHETDRKIVYLVQSRVELLNNIAKLRRSRNAPIEKPTIRGALHAMFARTFYKEREMDSRQEPKDEVSKD